jgi:MoxR-like ATPase
VVLPALRHRLVLNVEAQLQNIDTDTVLNQILEEVK